MATPQFPFWPSPERQPGDTKGGKAVLESGGKCVFGELAILDDLLAEGWDGRWIDNYPLPPTFRKSYWDDALNKLSRDAANIELPGHIMNIYRSICSKAGDQSGGGAWDVIAWRGNEMLFIEAKRAGSSDKIRDAQIRWFDAALSIGVPAECFLYCEWVGVGEPPKSSGRTLSNSARHDPPQNDTRAKRPAGGDLHRRSIRSHLIKRYGWKVESRVAGLVEVRVPPGNDLLPFIEIVRKAVEGMDYKPSVRTRRDSKGHTWVSLSTPETLEQKGRGAHTK